MLVLAGTRLHVPHVANWAVLDLLVLLTLAWPWRRRIAAAIGFALVVLMIVLLAYGRASWVLGAVPVVISGALAWMFARTLRAGREPLVARMARIIDGPERLRQPGVAAYTRGVTGYWAVLLTVQCLLLAVCGLLLAREGHALAAFARLYLHVGGYLMPVLAMLAEYALRRWRFRHLPQLGLRSFLQRLMVCWPRIVRGASE